MTDMMDEVDFSEEDVEHIVRSAIEGTLKECPYNPKKVNDWIKPTDHAWATDVKGKNFRVFSKKCRENVPSYVQISY